MGKVILIINTRPGNQVVEETKKEVAEGKAGPAEYPKGSK